MTVQIEFSASDDVTKALVELGRTEDVKFSPDNRRLAIAGFTKNKILIVDSCIEETTIRKRVTLSNCITITSPSLRSPHGLCFIDNQTIIVANRDGEAAILTLPQVSDGESIFELSALQTIHANEAQLLKTPGSITASRIGLDLYEVLICNNYAHTVTRHILDARETFRAIRNEILLQKGLAVPDGIAVNSDMSWIAVSNHNTHSVLMFRNDSTLDPSSEPAGILSNVCYPHGVCFTQNNNFVLVADAGAPYVHLYAKTRGDWKGKRDPIASIRTMDDEIFLRGRCNSQEGGPKGLDIANNMTVFVTTCQHQTLAFFDLKKILYKEVVHEEKCVQYGDRSIPVGVSSHEELPLDTRRSREVLIRVLLQLDARINFEKAEVDSAYKQLQSIYQSRSWKITVRLRRAYSLLRTLRQKIRCTLFRGSSARAREHIKISSVPEQRSGSRVDDTKAA
jgi:hypothetical protein